VPLRPENSCIKTDGSNRAGGDTQPIAILSTIESIAMKKPEVDLSDCIQCDVCVEACPQVFRKTDAGYIEVADLAEYPETDVEDAIKNCPADCIYWVEL
jgi:ferredoxin